MIDKPIVYNKQRADILAQIATIALLLYRAFAFIVKISMLFANYGSSKDPAIAKQLQPHYVSQSILSLSENLLFWRYFIQNVIEVYGLFSVPDLIYF